MRKNKPPMKGSARKMMRIYVRASGRESGGVRSQTTSDCAVAKPVKLIASDSPRKKTALVPTTRFASAMFLAPTHCAIMIVDAIEKPNMTPNKRNITTLAFPTAARDAAPRNLPTQMAFTEPFTDCSTLPDRMGNEKTNKARGMDPSVKENLGATISPNSRECRRAQYN